MSEEILPEIIKFIENNQSIFKLKILVELDERFVENFHSFKSLDYHEYFDILDSLENNQSLIELDIKRINCHPKKLDILKRNQILYEKRTGPYNIKVMKVFDCNFKWK